MDPNVSKVIERMNWIGEAMRRDVGQPTRAWWIAALTILAADQLDEFSPDERKLVVEFVAHARRKVSKRPDSPILVVDKNGVVK